MWCPCVLLCAKCMHVCMLMNIWLFFTCVMLPWTMCCRTFMSTLCLAVLYALHAQSGGNLCHLAMQIWLRDCNEEDVANNISYYDMAFAPVIMITLLL